MSKKIYQLSADWCGPCKSARTIIKSIEGSDEWWQWVDIGEDNGEELNSLVATVRPKNVPTFVVADMESMEIFDMISGFSRQKVLDLKSEHGL